MDNKGYNKANKIYQSSFIGYFPEDKPRYSIAVVIQNGSESKLAYGGVVSAPVFKEVAEEFMPRVFQARPGFYSPFVNDVNYKYYGLKSDISKILNVFHLSFIDSATSGTWRNMSLYNNQVLLNSVSYPPQSPNIIPDVHGLGLKDAIYLLENFGLKVMAAGKGKVMYQSLCRSSL